MAPTFFNPSINLSTLNHLASRDDGEKKWSFPIWGYVIGCIGIAAYCFLVGFVYSMLNRWGAHRLAQKGGDPEALAHVETAGSGFTFKTMFKGPGAQQNEDASVLETDQKTSMPTKVKRVFQKFGRGRVADDTPSMTMVGTSATNTVGRNSGEWSAEPPMYVAKKDDEAEVAQSRTVEVADNDHDAIKRC